MPQYAASQLACLREREELKRSWQHRHRHYLPESTNLHRSAAGNVVIHGTSYSAGSMWSEVVVAIGESGGEPEIGDIPLPCDRRRGTVGLARVPARLENRLRACLS